jgi:hypothetical protein
MTALHNLLPPPRWANYPHKTRDSPAGSALTFGISPSCEIAGDGNLMIYRLSALVEQSGVDPDIIRLVPEVKTLIIRPPDSHITVASQPAISTSP